MAHRLEIPIRLIRQILFDLTEAGLLVEVRIPNCQEICYQPAQDVDHLTIQDVLESLDKQGMTDIPVEKSQELDRIQQSLETFIQKNKKSEENFVLKNL